jgi:hypothetical protein
MGAPGWGVILDVKARSSKSDATMRRRIPTGEPKSMGAVAVRRAMS